MTIRTPDDEVSKPGYFYPPFEENKGYQGATYAGHSDLAVDFNRRTKTGGWLDDRGDPVLASAAGTVKATTPADGYVLLSHPGGYATEYRHMEPVLVKPGQKVQRGDIIGKIGEAGNAPNGTHLHARHYRNGKPIQMRFEGKPVATSVAGSDAKPKSWSPPAPVYVVGPPPRATWESAYREAAKAIEKREERIATLMGQVRLATEERDDARRARDAGALALSEAITARDLAQANAIRAEGRIRELEGDLNQAGAQVAALGLALTRCQEQAPDCSAIEAERDGALERAQQEQERANVAEDRASDAEAVIEAVRRAVAA